MSSDRSTYGRSTAYEVHMWREENLTLKHPSFGGKRAKISRSKVAKSVVNRHFKLDSIQLIQEQYPQPNRQAPEERSIATIARISISIEITVQLFCVLCSAPP